MASGNAPKPAKYVSPRTVALYGILAALTAAITYASYTPFSPTKGYFNLGESMVFFSALVFGWRAGAICGGVGSAAADILLASGIYAPITLVAKGIEGFVTGVIGRLRGGSHWLGISWAITWIVGFTGMLIALPEERMDMFELLMIALIAASPGLVLLEFYLMRRDQFSLWAPVVIAIVAGGSCMIVTYFVGELYLLNVGLGKAIAEVPINIAQVFLGGIIGSMLSYYVKRAYPAVTRDT